jgi:hypothetical protein
LNFCGDIVFNADIHAVALFGAQIEKISPTLKFKSRWYPKVLTALQLVDPVWNAQDIKNADLHPIILRSCAAITSAYND